MKLDQHDLEYIVAGLQRYAAEKHRENGVHGMRHSRNALDLAHRIQREFSGFYPNGLELLAYGLTIQPATYDKLEDKA